MAKRSTIRPPIHLAPGEGRDFPMGPLRAVFKADGAETNGRYSISEWWLDPRTRGPGAHSHDEDDVFFVIEGEMSFFVGDRWFTARAGSFVLAPGGVKHDFENRSGKRAGMLNVSVPGDFEPHMAGISEWFIKRSPADAATLEQPVKAKASSRPRSRASTRSRAAGPSRRSRASS